MTHWDSGFYLYCRIHELQEDIIKVKLDLENAQEFIKHLNTQVGINDLEALYTVTC